MPVMKRFSVFAALLLVAVTISAQSPTPNDGREAKFEDSLLDKLAGNWRVVRKFGDSHTAENTVRVVWVIKYQFLELSYLDVATPPQYEAMAFIGFDHTMSRYVLHWLDVYGGRRSEIIRCAPAAADV